MPVYGSTSPAQVDGTAYVEVVQCKTGLKAAETDTLVVGGPYIYNDTVQVSTGTVSASDDSSGGDILDTCQVSTALIAQIQNLSQGIVFEDVAGASTGIIPDSLNIQITSDFAGSLTALSVLALDTFIPGLGELFYDIPLARTGLSCAVIDQLLCSQSVLGVTGLRADSSDTMLMDESPDSILGGGPIGGSDYAITYYTLRVSSGLSCAVIDVLKAIEKVQARTGLTSSLAPDPVVFQETSRSVVGARVASSDSSLSSDQPNAITGLRAVSVVTMSVIDSCSSLLALACACASSYVSSVRSGTITALATILAQTGSILDVCTSRTGALSGAIDSARYDDICEAVTGLRVGGKDNHFMNGLVPAIRRTIRESLPTSTVLRIFEANPTVRELWEIAPPFLGVIVHDPQPLGGYAVRDMAMEVMVDLVYVVKRQYNKTDELEGNRRILDPAIMAMLTNYTLYGNATKTELEAVPVNRQTEYQERFEKDKESVIVNVATIKVDIVRQV